tara:strand:+ start:349 stop:714 length:366 start_codon:yes stop_codon:yes gene_type:complete
MNYTITELTDGNAVITFADGAWANVPVLTADTKDTFEERVQGYATKTFGSNPAWIAVNQTGSVTQVAYADTDGSETDNPAWLDARIAAYGSLASQIEFITENGLTAWQEEVAAIKLANPIV